VLKLCAHPPKVLNIIRYKRRYKEMTRLPVDVYRIIVAAVSSHDLATLCVTSSDFRYEVQRVLYHTVDFLGSDYHRIASWSTSVASDPHLACIVHTLSLPGSICRTPLDIDPIRQTLHIALQSVTNLKCLITRETPAGEDPLIVSWVLENCVFRLHTLSLSIEMRETDLWKFLSTQPDICSWSPTWPRVLPDPSSLAHPPDGIPPNLSALDTVDYMLKVFQRRPIEFLSLYIMPTSTMSPPEHLGFFKDTLTSLYCHIWTHFDWIVPEAHIASLADRVPRVKVLGYTFTLSLSGVRIIVRISLHLPNSTGL
jgi:hypothetical protein